MKQTMITFLRTINNYPEVGEFIQMAGRKKGYIKTRVITKDRGYIRPLVTTKNFTDFKNMIDKYVFKKVVFIQHITPHLYVEYLEVRTLRKIYRYYLSGGMYNTEGKFIV